MQHIYKKISLYFNYIHDFYNLSMFFSKTIIVFLILSSFSVLSEEKKIFLNQFDIKVKNKIKINEQSSNILKEENKKNNTQLLKNYKKIINEPNYISHLSKNVFIKKTIYIKKNSNFFKSACESRLTLYDINSIIKAMEWQISFHKIHVNSTFNLIFLKKNINLKKDKHILLGIELNDLGKTYYAIRAPNGNFYDLNGINKSKMIMNFSFLKKYRISSNFNLHRVHPITHHISRHLGVDLAMPQGTLVLASSNGKIAKAGFNKISGFYIVLNNQNEYTTKYMHLKKILVKVGQNIKINQKIALSGNTGRTTGPHLHYEIWINKHAINPIHAQSHFIEQLTKKERILYLKTSKIILSKFK